jgi:hypothetical protein
MGNSALLVGFAAGGAADTAARLIARRAGEIIGRPIAVQNRPGAGGNIVHKWWPTRRRTVPPSCSARSARSRSRRT